MPWIKGKVKGVSFDLFIIRIMEYVEMRLKNELPIIHRILYRCYSDEYVIVRRIMCIIGSFIICKLLLMVCVESEQTSENIDRHFIHKWGLLLMMIGFVCSVQIRTVLSLLLPYLVITSNGLFFYIRLLKRIYETLSPSIMGNISALWNMFSCVINNENLRNKAMIRLAARPITDWLFNWNDRISSIQNLSDDLKTMDLKINNALMFYKNSSEKFSDYCESLMNPLKDHNYCFVALQESFNNSDFIQKQIYNQVYNVCFKIYDEFSNQFCKQIINNNNNNNDKIKNITNILMNKINLMDSLQLIQLNNYYFNNNNELFDIWNSLIGYRMDLEEEFRNELEWIGLIGLLIRLIFLSTLLLAIINTIGYHNNYIRYKHFDNHYIDRYFYHIDSKRKSMNKIHLIPLRGNDRHQLIKTFAFKSTKHEKTTFQTIGIRVIMITLLLITIFLYIDYVLSDFVNIISIKLSTGDHFNLLIHRFQAKANGGYFASIIDNFVKKFHFNYTEIYRHDWHTCRRINVKQLNWSQYQNILIDALLLLFLNLLSIHFYRIRHLICDFFYYRYGKERTIYLYNNRLNNRKKFLQLRHQQINLIVDANRLLGKTLDNIHQYDEDHQLLKKLSLIKRLFKSIKNKLWKKQCFICHCSIKQPYYYCPTVNCRLIYCEPCFNDFLFTCLNCGVNGVS